ncbi:MAG TPA: GDP-mannose 4,6-dehydratase [Catalimonadaceae bacterium]|nr:GDP-mannose 4,6-dehydratase [Catalimonadaceae bacterium]
MKGSILITGVAGFIGSHLAERFLREGYSVAGIDNFDPFYPRNIKEKNLDQIRKVGPIDFYELDISIPGALDSIQGKFETVVHLAAKAGVLPSIHYTDSYIQANVIGTQQVLEFMKSRNIRKLAFASSSSVYGNNPTPFSETDDVSKPISPYAFTKKSCELMNHAYHHLFGLDVINLRFFTVIGERQRPDLAIHKFVKAIRNEEPIRMYGPGDSARDYTYVGDIVEGVFQAVQYVNTNENVFEIINLGNQNPVSLREMIDTIYEVMKKEPNIIQTEKQPGDVETTFANIGRAKALLGYQPKTSFREAIRRFVDWSGNPENI